MSKENLQGVMLNCYPDSLGGNLSGVVSLLERPELEGVFNYFYVLPSVFHNDLDRGFSVIDYDINEELATPADIERLKALGIELKFDLVLNHLSVGSPQFQDMLAKGDQSEYLDFFINWNQFWAEDGALGDEGYVIPKEEYLNRLFMRKPGLPILMVRFPDGSDRPYWNTFYQEICYHPLTEEELLGIDGVDQGQLASLLSVINTAIEEGKKLSEIDLGDFEGLRDEIESVVEGKRSYLGQMDLNAQSPLVWKFYEDTLAKLRAYGAKVIRLDAFAYLHKEPGQVNFFNKPETWNYLGRIKEIADNNDLTLLPEIHAEYGKALHEEVSNEGYLIYDFFLPGLLLHALLKESSQYLIQWAEEQREKGMRTVTMLGCHDGIPLLDLKGGPNGEPGLLSDEQIDEVMDSVLERGGKVKNLFGPDGKKISYYQVNATYYSALGEREDRLALARAIHLFMPGIPQIWYLDLFAGTNDYEAVERGGAANHKEINRTNLTSEQIAERLEWPVVKKQLELLKVRNAAEAFQGEFDMSAPEPHLLHVTWTHGAHRCSLEADLSAYTYRIEYTGDDGSIQSIQSS
ncbi:MAG: hypothetical protein KDD62_09250 [Bdellovibrionales bacterium]|nr:hypothetical protein [Bdellovibrionales bacterium]